MPENTVTPLVWDGDNKTYSTGVSMGAIFVNGMGEAWNGLTAVNESPSGADTTALYANDNKYMELRGNEEYGFTIEAYTYPEMFEQCDGSAAYGTGDLEKDIKYKQAERKHFAFAYITKVYDKDNNYKRLLHVVFDASASPSSRDHSTINESPEAVTFSWECTTTPVTIKGSGANEVKACNIEIMETDANSAAFENLLNALYVKEPGTINMAFITTHFKTT